MPKLGERKEKVAGIATYLILPEQTRKQLESAIGRIEGVNTLRGAVVEAAAMLGRRVTWESSRK